VLINRRDVGWGRKKVPYKYPRRVTSHKAANLKERGRREERTEITTRNNREN
jgi:hypothetical protein